MIDRKIQSYISKIFILQILDTGLVYQRSRTISSLGEKSCDFKNTVSLLVSCVVDSINAE